MFIEMLKKHYFFHLYINDMAAFDGIKSLCLKRILFLHSVKDSSSPNSPLLFAIVFWS